MCGIAGIVDERGVRPADVEAMDRALAHRGPDDSGVHLTPRVALGHRRLSIIDLSGGHQPLSNEDGSIWITFNGEIYNYRELAAELAPRHQFRTESDTETIVHLYEELGVGCLGRLRGMFAFAIHDTRNDRIFAARDHLGQKPLYYAAGPGRFAFASEIKALLALDPRLRRLDPEALCEYLALRIVTPPRSMFHGVRKLPPAHYLVYERGRLTVERYWDLAFEPKLTLGFEEAVEELDRRLGESVEHHLVSDVPVGAFLSGGMDSSLVLAVMSRRAGGAVATFTGDLPYAGRSELPYARRVAQAYGARGHELTITPALVEDLPEVIWHLDEPSDPLCICLYALARFTRRHVKVVLGGDGGDELFAGYDRYYGHRYAGWLARLPRALRRRALGAVLERLPRSTWYRGAGHRLGWLLEMAEHEGSGRYASSLRYFYFSNAQLGALLPERLRRGLGSFDPEESIRVLYDAASEREAVDRMLYADAATRLPDHPVMILDRMAMAHGLEARSPLLDHRLAEFCAQLPPAFKIRGTRRRVIQSALARRYLPREILTRDKQGFSSAFPYMMAGAFSRLYDSFLRGSRLVEDGCLEAEPMLRLLEEHRRGDADHAQRLWLLCNAELWYRLGIRDEGIEALREQIRGALGAGERAAAASEPERVGLPG